MNLNNAEIWVTLDQAYEIWDYAPKLDPAFRDFQDYLDYLKSKNYRIL